MSAAIVLPVYYFMFYIYTLIIYINLAIYTEPVCISGHRIFFTQIGQLEGHIGSGVEQWSA